MEKIKLFEPPYHGSNSYKNGMNILYTIGGDSVVVLKLDNVAVQYNGDEENYNFAHEVFGQIIKTIGSEYYIQKTDIVSKAEWKAPEKIVNESNDFLEKKFFEAYEGRVYKKVTTYLSIIKKSPKGRMYTYNEADHKAFMINVNKIKDTLELNKFNVSYVSLDEYSELFNRYIAVDFSNQAYSIDNIDCTDEMLIVDNRAVYSTLFLDIDDNNVPNQVTPHGFKPEIGREFPVDNFNWLFEIETADLIIYNQVIYIPDQMKVKAELEAKKKKHKSMPDPDNHLSVNDIDAMLLEIADTNELIVKSCFYVTVCCNKDNKEKSFNTIKNHLYSMGITPSKKTKNQYELWYGGLPGNVAHLKQYNYFTTSRPAALCFFFHERLPLTEDSEYLLWFMDRQGVPIGIDTSEVPMNTGRITNRNKFILGPSGTGKSFFTNRYVKQAKTNGADIVLVDNGDSYLGLCNYFGGVYYTYTEEKPITMNPFVISRDENTEEHRDFIKTLIAFIWITSEGRVEPVSDTLLTKLINAYYDTFFLEDDSDYKISELTFNSFYEFSCYKIPQILNATNITFPLSDFLFILEKFYKTGQYPTVLNAQMDQSLFTEPFIVFEIDNIKNNKVLFPITTLIIMQVFLQKMKYRKNIKKILVIEEAWKAIASPIMADYILSLYKTIRKYDGEAIVVTQEVSDILDNPIIKDSIINNSDTIILLDQTKLQKRYAKIADVLSLDEVQQKVVFSIHKLNNKSGRGRFNEVYIKRGSVGEVYGVEVPLHEYFTYTTNRKEKECLAVFLNEYSNDYGRALEALIQVFEYHSHTPFQKIVPIINNITSPNRTEAEAFNLYRGKQDFKDAVIAFLDDYYNSSNSLIGFSNSVLKSNNRIAV